MRSVILGLLLVGGAAHLNAASYYVDYAEGTDGNSGAGPASAWKHCPGDPAATGNVAGVALAAGDTIYFKGGVSYVLTASTGIALNWDGASGSVIAYDGNSGGTWGSGRARFTDNHGGGGLTAFFSPALRRYLAFRSLEFSAIGGAESLPADPGAPVPARFGGGIGFAGGVENATIDDCVFRDLGYWFHDRPMSADSIAGAGVLANSCRGLAISRCQFAQMAIGFDLANASDLTAVSVANCTFGDSIVWPIRLPSNAAVNTGAISLPSTTFATENLFTALGWSGYGYDPRADVSQVGAGATIVYAATAISSPAPSFQWRKNGLIIPGATDATLRLSNVTLMDAGIYSAVAANEAGSTLSNTAVLIVNSLQNPSNPSNPTSTTSSNPTSDPISNPNPNPNPDPILPPVITLQPVALVATRLGTAAFTVAANDPAATYQWMKNGAALPGFTSASLIMIGVTENDVANYSAVVSNAGGSVTSNVVGLTLNTLVLSDSGNTTQSNPTLLNPTTENQTTTNPPPENPLPPPPVPPQFTAQPVDQSANSGDSVTFTAAASGSPDPVFQWYKNGASLAGATSAALTLSGVTSADEGTYYVIANNAAGSVTSNSVRLAVTSTTSATLGEYRLGATARALDGSWLRRFADPGESTDLSIVVEGTANRTVMLRAIGPGLVPYGFPSFLGDPIIDLYSGPGLMSHNDDWGGGSTLLDAFAQTGAFPLGDPSSKDAAIVVTLAPGTYRAVFSGGGGTTGYVLIQAFELP